jgi:hypothetical protein
MLPDLLLANSIVIAIFRYCIGLALLRHLVSFPKAIFPDLYLFLGALLLRYSDKITWMSALCIVLPVALVAVTTPIMAPLLMAIFYRRKLILRSEEGSGAGREFLGRPLLFPARLSHTRMFPEKYSYWYSYFAVGFPVGLRGRVGTLLSIDNEPGPQTDKNRRSVNWKRCWFTVDTALYLDRANDHLGLEGKLREFLRSQVRLLFLQIQFLR